jgi:putative two-component system response regulator
MVAPETMDGSGATILVVDDNELNRDLLLRRVAKQGHRADAAVDGVEALDRLMQKPVDLVLLDIMMPRMDGYEVLARMKATPELCEIPVVMITAIDETESAVKCIELGAEDYLHKPFDPVILRARINSSLNKKRLRDMERRHKQEIEENNRLLSDRVREQVHEIASAQLGAIFAMSKLAESRDPETGEHLERMREYCRVLALAMRQQSRYRDQIDGAFVENIYAASPLHDIGKVGVQDSILTKPGKLTAEEWRLMQTHSVIGAETLREVDRQHPGNAFVGTGIRIAENHHENWDGTGYPYGRRGEEIPIEARILALGDVYDALTSRRCYKEPWSHDDARDHVLEQAGRKFDPGVVEAFAATEQEFVLIRREYQDRE